MTDLTDLIEMSRRFGGDPEYLLAGGGNTSQKEGGKLYVKASGTSLAEITEKGFVIMAMEALEAIWSKTYPEESAPREAAILADMMAARLPGETARPSVEALLHSLIRGRFVIHTHPALVNGITCGRSGEAAMTELFGEEALWVPLVEPGFILAREIRQRLAAHEKRTGVYPRILFLQNHGLFVSAETREEVYALHDSIREKVLSKVGLRPEGVFTGLAPELLARARKAAEAAYGKPLEVCGTAGPDLEMFAAGEEAFEPLRLPFNPDQIVYSGPGPLRLDTLEDLPKALAAYMKRWNREPQSFLLRGQGGFGLGATEKKAEAALSLLVDSVKIALYSRSFGGPLPMTEALILFIRDWEVESYRAKVAR